MQQPEPLGRKLGIHIAHAGDIAAGSVDAIDETDLDRVGRGAEHDRNGRGGGLRGDRSDHGARCREYSHPATHQIGRQFRQPIVLIRRESVFDCDVTTLFIAGLAQAFAECRYESFHPLGRTRPKKPDHCHRRLLRTRAERPCSRRAAQQRDEIAAFHVWMAPVWQEIIWRAAQRSLAVMYPACWCSPGGLLALMGPRTESSSFERDRCPDETPGLARLRRIDRLCHHASLLSRKLQNVAQWFKPPRPRAGSSHAGASPPRRCARSCWLARRLRPAAAAADAARSPTDRLWSPSSVAN